MRNNLAVLAIVIGLVPASGALAPAHAFGAIAIGQTANGVEADGLVYGTSWSYSTQDKANQEALDGCRSEQNQKDMPLPTKECKVADTFRNQCYAVALDPRGGAGVGFAIANDQGAAKDQALANCTAAAGSGGAQFCKVMESNCDGQ